MNLLKKLNISVPDILLIIFLLILVAIFIMITVKALDGFTKSQIKVVKDNAVTNNLTNNNFNIIVNLPNNTNQTDKDKLLNDLKTMFITSPKPKRKARPNDRNLSFLNNKIINNVIVNNDCSSSCPQLFFELKGRIKQVTGFILVGDGFESIKSKLDSRLNFTY